MEESHDEVGPGRRGGSRRIMARALLMAVMAGGLIWLSQHWQGRAIDATLVHQFPVEAENLLPASVEVLVWQDDTLHADAYFPNPDSLQQLEHSVRVPPGDYQVSLKLFHTFGQNDLRIEQSLTIDEQGRYFLHYDLPPP